LHTKVSNQQLEFLATADMSGGGGFDTAKLYLPVTLVKKPNLKLSDATKSVLQRAAVPFSDFVYEGIVAGRNYVEEDTHHFDFVVACEYVGTGFITRNSLMTGPSSAHTIHCMFFPFAKILESVKQSNDPLQHVLSRWLETSPTKMLPVIKPHENYSWAGKTLDLKAFVLLTNKNYTANGNSGDGTQLLLIETDRGHLYLPGGRFNQDEPLKVCCTRSAKVQTGFDVDLVAISEIVYGWADYSPLHFYVVATISGGDMKTVADENSKGVKWVSLDEVAQQLNSQRGGEYQKMWELKVTLLNFVESYKTNNFISLYG